MSRWTARLGWVAAGVLAITLIGTLASDALGGPLDPPGAPASTMQRLSDIAPSWSRILSDTNGDGAGCGSTRFECIFGGVAVLDHETGLVWQRSPAYTARNWQGAVDTCRGETTGNRRGWRLPYIEEYLSLVDLSESLPAISSESPFTGIDGYYWSANTFDTPGSSEYEAVLFRSDDGLWIYGGRLTDHYVWCVRGGPGVDAITQH